MSLAKARSWLRLAEYAVPLASLEADFSFERLDLLRWSCLWALACTAGGPQTQQALLEAPPSPALLALAGGQERWEGLRQVLGRSPIEDASQPLERVTSDRRLLRAFANAIIAALEKPDRELSRAVRAAGIRISAIALTIVGLAVAVYATAVRQRLPPNLAEGRSWKTSSTWAICDPAHLWCGGAGTAILFHTQEEQSPWAEMDLGSPRNISRVDIRNRIDCCQERAVPLIIEVSDDERNWNVVARQDDQFVEWTAKFPPKVARYLRLRVPRRTMLHVEYVGIR